MTSLPTRGWPWMMGFDSAITHNPIPLFNDDDDRPLLTDLFAEHRALIDQIAAELATDPLYDANKHDDLWVVRFLLSHKRKLKPSIKAAKETLAYRAKYNLDETDIRYMPFGRDTPGDEIQRILKYCKDDAFQIFVPDARRGVVGFFNLAGKDQHEVVKNLNESDWLPSFIYVAEYTHQWVDYLSRTSGRLTSSVRLCDASDLKFADMNMECQKRDANAMKVTEDCYPQLVKSFFVVGAPSWVEVGWRLVRPLFPKRVVEKLDFVSPAKRERDRQRLLKYISLDHLPTRYGGNNDVWPVKLPLPLAGQ